MILNYFSLAYFLYLGIALGLVAALYLGLRKKSSKTQKYVILSLMLVNLFQHIFKLNVYPQYDGGFSGLCTAYNMCAFLIIVSPLALLLASDFIRDFVFYIGTAAGIVAILVPYWNVGKPAFSWENYRFYLCHALLFASSILPLLLRLHNPSWKCFWRIGLCFFLAISLIIVNDVIFISMGIYDTLSVENLYQSLATANPVWSFGVPDGFGFIKEIAKALSPDVWVGENPAGIPVPILWYFIPVYLGITLVAFPICALVDKKNFVSDIKRLRDKCSALWRRLKKER